jgi:hypothetical protein
MISERRAIRKSGCERSSRTRSETDATAKGWRRLDVQIARRGILFVEDGLEVRLFDRPPGDDALEGVEVLTRIEVVSCHLIVLGERPNFDLKHLERI